MDKFKLIKVSLCYESEFDVRGKGYDDPKLNDLVASIKEKGVIVPVIAREKPRGNKRFEVVVGKRRLKASVIAKKEMIKAEIRKLTDDEARELQIIENLQRLDVHPLDEGFAYRGLIEESKYTRENIAIKVGKSESYIRQRLFLTNLIERATKSYRSGKITDGHAVLIAKLSPNDQNEVMKYLANQWQLPLTRELKEWIGRNFYHSLNFQPWLKNKEVNRAVGKCIECEPDRNSLFGKVKEGACTDLKCWKRKMRNYVSYQIADAKQKGIELLKVSKEYSYSPRGKIDADIITRGNYESLGFKKKDRCKYAQRAIVAIGKDMGTFLWVCVSPDCSKHCYQHATYKLTPKEKERRKKEAKKQREKRKKEEERIVETLNKIKWPLNKKTLNAIFEMTLQGQGTTVLRPVAKRFGIEPKKEKSYGSTYYDWEISIREASKKMSNAEKLRFIIGILLERIYWDSKNKILKSLSK